MIPEHCHTPSLGKPSQGQLSLESSVLPGTGAGAQWKRFPRTGRAGIGQVYGAVTGWGSSTGRSQGKGAAAPGAGVAEHCVVDSLHRNVNFTNGCGSLTAL